MITVPLVYFIIAVCFVFMIGTKAGHRENRKAAEFAERQEQLRKIMGS